MRVILNMSSSGGYHRHETCIKCRLKCTQRLIKHANASGLCSMRQSETACLMRVIAVLLDARPPSSLELAATITASESRIHVPSSKVAEGLKLLALRAARGGQGGGGRP